MPAVDGVTLVGHPCGLKYKGRPDLLIASFADNTTVGGVFTRSKTAAAPVIWCRGALTYGRARGLVVNAGNANAFTGSDGLVAVKALVDEAAGQLKCATTDIFVASTGVIGEKLPHEKIVSQMETAIKKMAPNKWRAAATAITTTDTFPKGVSRITDIDGEKVVINGIAKGSGMIAPDMATMLAFIFTDAKLPSPVLQELLEKGANRSFNCTTVDGDTSTSDTLLMFATGQAKHKKIKQPDDKRLKNFRHALWDLMTDLAQLVVRDGEGATKFVEIAVSGAESNKAAKTIALSIANSPLVKTAIAGEDPNWGRIVMAVGKAGEKANRDRLSIAIGGHAVAERGDQTPEYDEKPVAKHMSGDEIRIDVDVGVGKGKAVVWTCDLTHGYISINADYRS